MLRPSLARQLSLILVFFAACGRPDRPSSSDSSRTLAASRGPHTYPGALTKPIDAYSGDELYEFVERLEFTGSHERERRCRDASGCEGNARTRRTLVQVSAVATQDSLGAGDIPDFGIVQVRAINRGDAVEARYGMRPGGSLRYYVIVQRDSAGGLRWRLEELDTALPRRHVQVGTGRVVGCGHAWTPGARADFRTCEAAQSGDTAATRPGAPAMQLDAPLWIACEMGCCNLVS